MLTVVNTPLTLIKSTLTGTLAWLVGGAVRDRLLGRPIFDYDVALSSDPRSVAREIAKQSRGFCFELSDRFGTWRVIARDRSWQIDLVGLRGDDLPADLAERDFTINAMAEPVGGGELVDPYGGQGDLTAGRVRMVSERALQEDPLRALRAIRLAVELDFAIEDDTGAAIGRLGELLQWSAGERVFAELKRIVSTPAARRGIELMRQFGVGEHLLAELFWLRGITSSGSTSQDLYQHTLDVLDTVALILEDPGSVGLGEHAAQIQAIGTMALADELTHAQALSFAALLHDIGKPDTRTVAPDGSVSFPDHAGRGAQLSTAILRRWRVSQRLVRYVTQLVGNHTDVGLLLSERSPLSRRAIWRFLVANEPYEVDSLLLAVADRVAKREQIGEAELAAQSRTACQLLAEAIEHKQAKPEAPLVRGDELAAEIGIKPGPIFGTLLAQLAEDRLGGVVKTRADAIDRALALLDSTEAGLKDPDQR